MIDEKYRIELCPCLSYLERKYFWMRYYVSESNIPIAAPIPNEIAIPRPIVTGVRFCIMRFLIFKMIVDFI